MPSYRITTPDGQKFKITADNDEAAQAAISDLLSQAPAKQEMVGFGERSQREQKMADASAPPRSGLEELIVGQYGPDPNAELRHDVNVAKRMAAYRPQAGADDAFLHNYTFGLEDEAKAAAAGVAGLIKGKGFSGPYNEDMEARRKIAEEYAAAHPIKSLAAGAAGMLAGGLQMAPGVATTLPGMALEGATSAGIQGAIQGAGEGEGIEGRLKGAAIGGFLGGIVGGVAPYAAAGAKALSEPFVNTVRSAINPEKEAARRIAVAAQKDALSGGEGLSNIEFYKAKQAGNPVTLMDRGGENTRALAQSASNQSPDALNDLTNVIKPRFETQAKRLSDELSNQSKLGGKPEDFMELADQAAVRANGKLYREAYQKGSGSIWTPELERLVGASPTVQSALKEAIRTAGDREVIDGFGAMNPKVLLDEAGNLSFQGKGGLPAYPDLRLWDLTKRELDRMARIAKRGGDPNAGVYKQLAFKLKSELTKIPEAGPVYEKALQTAASHFGAENAYEAGMKFAAAKGMGARDAIKGISQMKPEERKLFREGYIQAMRDTLKDAPNNRDATLMLMKSDGQSERARVALGKDGARKLEAQLHVEEAMDALRKKLRNSTTTRQIVELGLSSAAGSGMAGLSLGADPTNLTFGALAGAAHKFGRGKLNDRLSAQIGKLLASNDPGKITLLINSASRSPQMMAALKSFSQSLTAAGGRAATEAITAQ